MGAPYQSEQFNNLEIGILFMYCIVSKNIFITEGHKTNVNHLKWCDKTILWISQRALDTNSCGYVMVTISYPYWGSSALQEKSLLTNQIGGAFQHIKMKRETIYIQVESQKPPHAE